MSENQPVLKDSGLFHCPVCQQGFKQRSNATAHYKAVHLNVKEECPHCGQLFKKLKHHIKDVHVSKQLVQCKYCEKKFPEGRLFKDHMNKTHMMDIDGQPLEKFLKSTSCPVCGDTILTTRLTRHMKLRHFLPAHYVVQCPLCSVHVKWLSWHLAKSHKGEGAVKQLKRCVKCEQYFLTNAALTAHLASHEEYSCSDCDLTFPAHLAMARHMYTEHNKVYNIGKQYKSGRSNWEVGTTSGATTYRVDKAVEEEGEEYEEESEEDEEDEEDIEESFTVLLDEDGNLQEIVTEADEHTEAELVSETTIDIVLEQKVEEVVDEEDNDTAEAEEEEPEETEEYEVELDGSNFQLVLAPSLTEKEPVLLQLLQENLTNTSGTKKPKLFERLVAHRSELPRSLHGVKLSAEDELVLAAAPKAQDIRTHDLQKFQISKKAEGSKKARKYEACPSRQAHLCPYCRQVLKTRNALSRHISVVHLAVRNFPCTECGKSYATKADTMKHIRAAHSEHRNTLVECDECGEKFKQCYLKRHQYYKHKGNELSKKCLHCDKDFKTREIMMKHIRKIHKRV